MFSMYRPFRRIPNKTKAEHVTTAAPHRQIAGAWAKKGRGKFSRKRVQRHGVQALGGLLQK
jgi:hypothetical protein